MDVSSENQPQYSPGPGQDADSRACVQYAAGDAWVVVVRGEVDMTTIAPLADALNRAAASHPTVVLDASSVTFADSTFLNLLLRVHEATCLRIAAPTHQLMRLFQLTAVDTVLDVRATLEAATRP
ncbi:anti-anti-sigma factor [Streptomyces sp. CB03234]|uniref:STAS domain-containing protein n=1 Tax=Streptomyces sp. (strain CB03234) TaxID=1703937 RepID=UPI00093DFA52|nr:STAS domain-containing protein [Streptomyces sp. CB03234]OKK03820.1 anti-anti-sigma factor [Streptomyces sp. CB03234]